jgi:hypothetical protein
MDIAFVMVNAKTNGARISNHRTPTEPGRSEMSHNHATLLPTIASVGGRQSQQYSSGRVEYMAETGKRATCRAAVFAHQGRSQHATIRTKLQGKSVGGDTMAEYLSSCRSHCGIQLGATANEIPSSAMVVSAIPTKILLSLVTPPRSHTTRTADRPAA